ncbi:hypothetical protein PspLS_00251 [Pyricularia sp. CBS 133598]|nr:hypothetical protein PspLS_00251 [Pyricularia sp. CBS 133598]
MAPKRKNKASSGSGAAARPAKRPPQANGNAIPTDALSVYTFGTGGAGELGFGPSPPLSSDPESHTQLQAPLLNPALSGVVQVSAGGMHCAALTAAGKILTWGANDTGNLGRDTAWEPKDGDDDDDGPVVNPLESTPMEVDGKWFGASGKRPDFVQVVAIDNATFGLAKDGKVWGWGSFRDEKGLFGFIKANLDSKPNPTDADKVQIKPTIIPGLPGNVKQLAGNTDHMLALTHNSQIWAWGGSSSLGELGRRIRSTRTASRFNSLVPTRVALPRSAAKHIRAVCAGPHHSFAIDANGHLFGWGANHFGQTGVNVIIGKGVAGKVAEDCITAPKLALGPSHIVDIAAGMHHSVACNSRGDVYAWGRCDEGQVGLDMSRFPVDKLLVDQRGRRTALLVPSIVPLPEKATRVAAGVDCSFAVTKSGRVYAWGYADGYRLGLPSEITEPEPKRLGRDANGNSILNKVFSWAGCGGQFGVIAGPLDDDDAPAPIQGGTKSADMGKAKHDAGEEAIVDQVDRPRTKGDNINYLIDKSGPGDDGSDDYSSDGGLYTPETDDEDDTDEWMSGSEESDHGFEPDEENESEESDDSSSGGGAPLPSTPSEGESTPDEEEESENDNESGGGELAPEPSSSSESEDRDYSEGTNEDNSEPSSSGSSGGEATEPSSSGSEDNESSEENADASSDRGSQRLGPLPADRRHLVDGMGLPIPGLRRNILVDGDDDESSSPSFSEQDEDNNHVEPSTGQLPANRRHLVDGMELPIPGLTRHVDSDGDDDCSEPTRGRPLVDGDGLPVPGMTRIVNSNGDDDERNSLFSSEGEDEDNHDEQNAPPVRQRGWSHVDGNSLPEPRWGYAPDFAVYADEEDGEVDEDDGGATLE